MFTFGIRGYQPRWLTGLPAITATHGQRLRALRGRRLTRTWLVWDVDDNEWFADGPVLLDFDGEQLEVNHQKFDELSLTWNSADPTQPVIWPTSDGFRLTWRDDTPSELVALQGQRLEAIDLAEWNGAAGDLANGTIAIHFTLTSGHLVVYNALDENGLHFDSPDHNWRLHLP